MLTSEKNKFKCLIRETLLLLCKNGLEFKNEFILEAMIGITLDQEEQLWTSIRETIQGCNNSLVLENNKNLKGDIDFQNEQVNMNFNNQSIKIENECSSHSIQISSNDEGFHLTSQEDNKDKTEQKGIEKRPNYSGFGSKIKKLEDLRYNSLLNYNYTNNLSNIEQMKYNSILGHHYNTKNNNFQNEKFSFSQNNFNEFEKNVSLLDPHFNPSFVSIKMEQNSISGNQENEVKKLSSNSKVDQDHNDESRKVSLNEEKHLQLLQMTLNKNFPDITNKEVGSRSRNKFQPSNKQKHKNNIHYHRNKFDQSADSDSQNQHLATTRPLLDSLSLINSISMPTKKKYICQICSKELRLMRDLRAHLATHHNFKKDFTCSVCDASFTYKHNLFVHLRTVHAISTDNIIQKDNMNHYL